MLEVKIENILPLTEVKNSLEKLVQTVGDSDDMIVIAENGKPRAILTGIHHMEKLTGTSHEELMPEDDYDDQMDLADIGTGQANSAAGPDDTAAKPEEEPLPDQKTLGQMALDQARLRGQEELAKEAGTDTSADSLPNQANAQATNPQFSYSNADAADTAGSVATPQTGPAPLETPAPAEQGDDELTMNVAPANPAMPPIDNTFPGTALPNQTPIPDSTTQNTFMTPPASTDTPAGSAQPSAAPVTNAPVNTAQPTTNPAPQSNGPVVYQ